MNQKELMNKALNYSIQLCIVELVLYVGIRLQAPLEAQNPSVVGAAFTFCFYIIDAWVWYWVASRHKDYLTQFFTGTSGLRFLLTLAVIGIYYLTAGPEIMTFLLVFVAYYIITMLHYSIFFSRVTKRI